MTTGRKCKRQDLRKKILYQVAFHSVERTEPASDQVMELARSIVSNKSSEFGVGKIHHLNLDGFYDFSSLVEPSMYLMAGKMTLLRLACVFGRDSVIAALIRAGADPSAQMCHCSDDLINTSPCCHACRPSLPPLDTLGTNLRKLFRTVVPMYSVWIVRVVAQLQMNYWYDCKILGDSCNATGTIDSSVDNSQIDSLVESLTEVAVCADYASTVVPKCKCSIVSSLCLFRFPVCEHMICETEFWEFAFSVGISNGISCPRCQQSLEYVDIQPKMIAHRQPLSTHVSKQASSTIGGSVICLIPSSDISKGFLSTESKPVLHTSFAVQEAVGGSIVVDWAADESVAGLSAAESFAKWEILPQDLGEAQEIVKKPKFKARALNDIAVLYLGYTKVARNTELFRAASRNNCRRLRALFSAGIWLDWQDEYGQTALFLAAWFGAADAVALLLRLGANQTICDNSGVDPYLVAVVNGRSDVVKLFKRSSSSDRVRDSYHVSDKKYGTSLESEVEAAPSSSTCKRGHDMKCLAPAIKILIDPCANHPGAGAFYVDDVFAEDELDAITSLFYLLPVAAPEKAACSDRSYYCDATGTVRKLLAHVLASVQASVYSSSTPYYQQLEESALQERTGIHRPDNDEFVFDDSNDVDAQGGFEGYDVHADNPNRICSEALPQMRFLHYREVGGQLAAHIDLARVFEKKVGLFDMPTSSENMPFRSSHALDRLLENRDLSGLQFSVPNRRASTHTFILYLTSCTEGGTTDLLHKIPGRRCELSPIDNILASVIPKRGRLLVFPHCCPHAGGLVVHVPKLLLRGEMI